MATAHDFSQLQARLLSEREESRIVPFLSSTSCASLAPEPEPPPKPSAEDRRYVSPSSSRCPLGRASDGLLPHKQHQLPIPDDPPYPHSPDGATSSRRSG